MKNRILVLAMAGIALVSCGGSANGGSVDSSVSSEQSDSGASSYDFKWVTPTGAPTLAFYDQGNNPNWVSASNPSEIVVPSFAAKSYDAIVFDGVSGLNLMTKNPKAANYKLARWINNLGFYVVSVSHTKEEASAWNSNWTVNAFVESGNSSRAFVSLAASVWNWSLGSGKITYETGVSQVAANIPTNAYDFYVVADPVYTTLKGKMGDKLHLIYDLQEEWGKAHEGASIPSAALFVNSSLYSAHQADYNAFLRETDERIDTLVENPSIAQKSLEEYGASDETAIVNGNYTKFGISESIISNLANLQKSNVFGFLKSGTVTDKKAVADSFNEALGGSKFGDGLFL